MPVGTLRSFLPPFKLIYKDRLSMREQAERARLEKETKDEAATTEAAIRKGLPKRG